MIIYGLRQTKKCLRRCTKCADLDHLAFRQSTIHAFVLHLYILKYPFILLVNNEGPDQTAWMRRQI